MCDVARQGINQIICLHCDRGIVQQFHYMEQTVNKNHGMRYFVELVSLFAVLIQTVHL